MNSSQQILFCYSPRQMLFLTNQLIAYAHTLHFTRYTIFV